MRGVDEHDQPERPADLPEEPGDGRQADVTDDEDQRGQAGGYEGGMSGASQHLAEDASRPRRCQGFTRRSAAQATRIFTRLNTALTRASRTGPSKGLIM